MDMHTLTTVHTHSCNKQTILSITGFLSHRSLYLYCQINEAYNQLVSKTYETCPNWNKTSWQKDWIKYLV